MSTPLSTEHVIHPGTTAICPCPGSGSVYHRWFNEGRTLGLHETDAMREAALDAIDECAAFHWGLLIATPEHVQEASRETFRVARQPFLISGDTE